MESYPLWHDTKLFERQDRFSQGRDIAISAHGPFWHSTDWSHGENRNDSPGESVEVGIPTLKDRREALVIPCKEQLENFPRRMAHSMLAMSDMRAPRKKLRVAWQPDRGLWHIEDRVTGLC